MCFEPGLVPDESRPGLPDLAIINARFIAPGCDVPESGSIAVADGKIVEISASPEIDAERQIDLRGAFVSAGLIDMHTHVDYGLRTPGVNARGVRPDLVGVEAGVPTVVDAGTTGPYLFGGFRKYVMEQSRTRILAFLHLARGGITMEPDIRHVDDVDMEAFLKAVELNRDLIVGVKTRLTGPGLDPVGAKMGTLAREAAEHFDLPVMVHTGDHFTKSPIAPKVTADVLDALAPGDIIEHIHSPVVGGVVSSDGRVMPEFLDAVGRGVFAGSSSGSEFMSFQALRVLLEAGIPPSYIATDLNSLNYRRGTYSLTETMSRFLAFGFSVPEVIALATSAPAKILKRDDELGHLAVGRDADLTLFDVVQGRWEFMDSLGEMAPGTMAILPLGSVRRGELVQRDWGPHSWGWAPSPGGYGTTMFGSRSVDRLP